MLKKIGIYSIFLVSGLLLGYVLFMPNEKTSVAPSLSTSETVGKWTCSMHPKVAGKENGSCPLCAMDLIFMDTHVESEVSETQFRMTKDAIALANVQTSTVSYANTDDSLLLLSGVITTNRETDAVQTTLLDGRIEDFYINSVGKKVRKGQRIGIMYSPELYLAQDKLLSSVSYKEKNMKLYLAARNTLGLWKMTDTQIDELIRSKKPQINFPLYADVNGTVTEVFALEGNYFKQGDVLFNTSDLRTVWAVFDAYETQLNSLRVGQEITLESTAATRKRLKAKIAFIEPVLNDLKRTATVRVVIPNKNNLLKPGMVVKGKINNLMVDKTIIAVPRTAVLWTGKRSLVYKKVSENEPIFELTEVLLGRRLGESYEVLDGLHINEIIVSEGAFTVDAAAQLSGKKSMMFNSERVEASMKKGINPPVNMQDRKDNINTDITPEISLE
jgi:Cu(I)/Ag(I) efflux system membrane fusion protein